MAWYREPVVQFFLLGALLFAADRWRPRSDAIVVSAELLEQLSQQTPDLDAAVAEHVATEALVREARKLGLAEHDLIVRRRLVQKMRFLLEEPPPTPTDAELSQWLGDHAERYRQPPRVAFEHVYFTGERPDAQQIAEQALRDGTTRGDPFIHGRVFALSDASTVTQRFGAHFADAVFSVETTDWAGPLQSSTGVHLVRILDRSDGRPGELADLREQLTADWSTAWSEAQQARAVQQIVDRYTVVMDPS